MIAGRLFPGIMIVLSLCAAGAYLAEGDYRRAIYWVAAAVLTTTVSF